MVIEDMGWKSVVVPSSLTIVSTEQLIYIVHYILVITNLPGH